MLPIVLDLYKKEETVWTMSELAMMYPSIEISNLKRRVNYWVKTGKLIKPRRGLIAKVNFNPRELAIKINKPSYISLETVLAEKGMIFQKYETIFLAARVSREVRLENFILRYVKVNDEILMNNSGIESKVGIWTAGTERAFLDTVYLRRNYHFDNLKPLNWEKVRELVKIYKNKEMEKRVDNYYLEYKENYV